MIKGYAQRKLDRNAWEIALIDSGNSRAYTIAICSHEYKSGLIAETTLVDYNQTEIFKALYQALQEMGIAQPDGVTQELKAVKYHLEDMRKLVFK